MIPQIDSLEGDNTNTSALSYDIANGGCSISGVSVGSLVGALLGDAGGAVGEDVAGLGREALLIGVKVSHDGELGVSEGVLLNENLSTHAGVDTRDTTIVARAVDVAGTEAD